MKHSYVKVIIYGKNIDNYLKRLIKNKINIKKITYLSPKEISIIVPLSDFNKINTKNTIYKLKIDKYYGRMALINTIKKNIYLYIFLFINILLIIFLSNIIFSISVVHPKKDIREVVESSLEGYGIKKYSLMPDSIKNIEEDILRDNSDKLEWLEIKREGTRLVVNIEERIINQENNNNKISIITSSKNAIILSINATRGEKVKKIGDYVTIGDEVISPYITKPDNTTVLDNASGTIIGEVWYNVTIEYPYYYKEEVLTGNSRDTYIIDFLGKTITFPFYKKYKDFDVSNHVILKNNLLPISIIKQHQYEVNIISEHYDDDSIMNAATRQAEEKLLTQNKKIEKVISSKILSKEKKNDSISLKIFFKVREDITLVKYLN